MLSPSHHKQHGGGKPGGYDNDHLLVPHPSHFANLKELERQLKWKIREMRIRKKFKDVAAVRKRRSTKAERSQLEDQQKIRGKASNAEDSARESPTKQRYQANDSINLPEIGAFPKGVANSQEVRHGTLKKYSNILLTSQSMSKEQRTDSNHQSLKNAMAYYTNLRDSKVNQELLQPPSLGTTPAMSSSQAQASELSKAKKDMETAQMARPSLDQDDAMIWIQ